jgi:hypothetical protein
MTQKITKITWNFQPNFDSGEGKYYLAEIGEPVKIVLGNYAQTQEDLTKVKEIKDFSADVPEIHVILENNNKYIVFQPNELFVKNIE